MNMFANLRPNQLGAISVMIAVFFFSVNDGAIKFLSGGYALHEVVLIRSVIGLVVLLVLIAPLTDGFAIFRTKRLAMHLIRGFCVVMANMTFFLGLAAMPLADAVAIFFVSPLIITVFSVVFLGEYVGPRRWAAVIVGLIGVVIMMRPGTSAFQYASLLPVVAAAAYAGLHMLTRLIGRTESAATMAFYIQIVFIVVCLAIGLAVGDGRFGDQSDPSLRFLLRAWEWPLVTDFPLMIFVGFGVAIGGYFISQAYRVAEASMVAPFEYLALPLSVLWGILVFDEWPDSVSYLGIALILGAGLFIVWRESVTVEKPLQNPRVRR